MKGWRRLSSSDGWTLTELLIVVAIIAILAAMFLLVNWKQQILKGYDIKRKADLTKIRRSFEEYYNDKNKYPDTASLTNCAGNTLAPYIPKIPCDPTTTEPYLYVLDAEDGSAGFRVCAKLQNLADPDITDLNCDPVSGCGWGEGYNYCLASGTTVTPPGFTPAASPTPTSTYAGPYACTPAGDCNYYDNPALHGCPVSWAGSCPPGACANPANRCTD